MISGFDYCLHSSDLAKRIMGEFRKKYRKNKGAINPFSCFTFSFNPNFFFLFSTFT